MSRHCGQQAEREIQSPVSSAPWRVLLTTYNIGIEMKHSHYFKPVSHLSDVDVYRVCDLFQIDDPSGAMQHAIKKLLLPGGRGAGKDRGKDVQEAIDSLLRWQAMQAENLSTGPRVMGMTYTVVDSPGDGVCSDIEDLHMANIGGLRSVTLTVDLLKHITETMSIVSAA